MSKLTQGKEFNRVFRKLTKESQSYILTLARVAAKAEDSVKKTYGETKQDTKTS